MVGLILTGIVTTIAGTTMYIKESRLERKEKRKANEITQVLSAIDRLRRGDGNTMDINEISISPLGYCFAKYVKTQGDAKRFVENLEVEMRKNNFKK